ncbi:MAG: DUF5625 family protein [Pseudomonadota bacterium]
MIDNYPLALSEAGSTVVVPFTVPLQGTYTLSLNFRFPSGVDGVRADSIAGPACRISDLKNQNAKAVATGESQQLGVQASLKLVVRRKTDNALVVSSINESRRCISSWSAFEKTRTVATVPLAAGEYVAQITNIDRVQGLDSAATFVSLGPGPGK